MGIDDRRVDRQTVTAWLFCRIQSEHRLLFYNLRTPGTEGLKSSNPHPANSIPKYEESVCSYGRAYVYRLETLS